MTPKNANDTNCECPTAASTNDWSRNTIEDTETCSSSKAEGEHVKLARELNIPGLQATKNKLFCDICSQRCVPRSHKQQKTERDTKLSYWMVFLARVKHWTDTHFARSWIFIELLFALFALLIVRLMLATALSAPFLFLICLLIGHN